MLERHSALQGITPVQTTRFTLRETPDFTLTQLAALGDDFPKSLLKQWGDIPAASGVVHSRGDVHIMRTGPRQLWLVAEGATPDNVKPSADVLVTPLSSSRCRILLAGPQARDILAKSAAIDFREGAFAAGQFVQTGIHHTPTLIHCQDTHLFHIYALRTYARTVWHWLADAADHQ